MRERLKILLRDITLIPTLACTWRELIWNKWDRIAENLYLGKMPFHNAALDKEEDSLNNFVKKQNKEHQDQKIGLVVSANQEAEIRTPIMYGLHNAVLPEEWEEKGVTHYLLNMQDFDAKIDPAYAANMICLIQSYRKKKQGTLIHCKAGHTRSTIIVASVFATFDLGMAEAHKDKSVEELVEMAIKHIRSIRSHISLTPENIKTINDIVTETKKLLEKEPDIIEIFIQLENEDRKRLEKLAKEQLKLELKNYLAEAEFKKNITELPSYKNLITYKEKIAKQESPIKVALKGVQRIKQIEILLKSLETFDGLANFMRVNGPVHSLLNASLYWTNIDVEEDQANREVLIDRFKKDIVSLLCDKIRCTNQQFLDLFITVRELTPSKLSFNLR